MRPPSFPLYLHPTYTPQLPSTSTSPSYPPHLHPSATLHPPPPQTNPRKPPSPQRTLQSPPPLLHPPPPPPPPHRNTHASLWRGSSGCTWPPRSCAPPPGCDRRHFTRAAAGLRLTPRRLNPPTRPRERQRGFKKAARGRQVAVSRVGLGFTVGKGVRAVRGRR